MKNLPEGLVAAGGCSHTSVLAATQFRGPGEAAAALTALSLCQAHRPGFFDVLLLNPWMCLGVPGLIINTLIGSRCNLLK